MKSRELALLPDARPVAAYVSTTMDRTLSDFPEYIPVSDWDVAPEIQFHRPPQPPRQSFYLSLQANFIADGTPAEMYRRINGTTNQSVWGPYLCRPGRSTEPFTVHFGPQFVFGPGFADVGLRRLDFGLATVGSWRILALPGSPVVITVWESPSNTLSFF